MRVPPRWPALALLAALPTLLPSLAVAECLESGPATIPFLGRDGLVVTAVNAPLDVLKATLPGHDRLIVWVGRPFPGLIIPRPMGADALDITLSPESPGCLARIERY
ncbi:hypothetical protein [Pararhodospirillum oryzae]|uniref:Pilus formation protein N-terminal domain-containing protein n=1 Tax=Pararhodospirillum oryzae TaxID=478448 RepID=A0A512H9P5_9PROT|nr:hypothetical protein [Pararhodospirillum oryzae]GEO82165.1 hypothetical protein ROR02_22960 [Pararhodospirillum oryzae]